jgi:hypothetical protein
VWLLALRFGEVHTTAPTVEPSTTEEEDEADDGVMRARAKKE